MSNPKIKVATNKKLIITGNSYSFIISKALVDNGFVSLDKKYNVYVEEVKEVAKSET